MTSRILHDLLHDKGAHPIPFTVLEAEYPRDLLMQILSDLRTWEQLERRMNHLVIIYLLIACMILPTQALHRVYAHLRRFLRWVLPEQSQGVPTASSLTYRRLHLGEEPLSLLMRLACQPLCGPSTPGAFLFGLRLVAIDSKLFDLCDNAETDWHFRGRNGLGQPCTSSPFPQLRLLSALEIGSHAHIGAVLAPGHYSEMSLVDKLLTYLAPLPPCLILQDSGFRGAWWLQRLLRAGHHSITRIQAHDYPCKGERLWDGSYLVSTMGSSDAPLQQPLRLRIIEYRLAPEVAQPLSQLQHSRSRSGQRAVRGADQVYRLATTLLDPVLAPAHQIAVAYHERWEVELVYDELQEHQQSTDRFLSKTVPTIMQEAWALLLGHYAVRAYMMRSASQVPGLDVDRLSFTQAISVLGTALTLGQPLACLTSTDWIEGMLQDLRLPASLLPPQRRLRSYPRVVKVAHTRFYRKRDTDRAFLFPDDMKSWKEVILLVAGEDSS